MRGSGILMPVSSLPTRYGIGMLGKCAYDFVDFLKNSGQTYWQILPIGPTGYGDSPYQSCSAFAANPYFIDIDVLQAQGLLTNEELESAVFGDDDEVINYARLFETRFALLEKAVDRFNDTAEFEKFCKSSAEWLEDYSLFMAIKEENGMVSFTQWPRELRTREKSAMEQAKLRLTQRVRYWNVLQFLFYSQWAQLKAYAVKSNIKIIGDIPIYVSPDSSELWAMPQLFETDENGCLTEVAGCPPDGFAPDGQLWGNPLYNWDYHKKTKYEWWLKRMKHAGSVYDVVRIDHFRGFEGFFAIKVGEKTARNGRWRKGPSKDFIGTLKKELPKLPIIAEDLGFLTDGVRSLLKFSKYPGMKVLEFAFDSREDSDYLPHNYSRNCIVYTGTHDNDTIKGWQKGAPKKDIAFARKYLNVKTGSLVRAFIRVALQSVADTAIIPLQDYLELGSEARINIPATLGGNWTWRVSADAFSADFAADIAAINKIYGR